jgi:hypothetical protein
MRQVAFEAIHDMGAKFPLKTSMNDFGSSVEPHIQNPLLCFEVTIDSPNSTQTQGQPLNSCKNLAVCLSSKIQHPPPKKFSVDSQFSQQPLTAF